MTELRDLSAAADADVVRATLLRVKAALLRGAVSERDLLEIERAIRAEYGGEARYVGRLPPASDRHDAIRADLAAGHSKRETARRHRMSLRQVQRLAATSSGDDDAL